MDFKIGLSTVDCRCSASETGLLNRQKKDLASTTPLLGFKINGFKLTDPVNAETVKFYNKNSTKIADVDGTIFWVTRLFMKNVHEFMYVKP